MSEKDHTIRLLTEMRDEMREGFLLARAERESLQNALELSRVERGALRRRIAESEMRTSTELLSVSGSLDEIKALLRQQSAIKIVVTDHERRIRKLEGE